MNNFTTLELVLIGSIFFGIWLCVITHMLKVDAKRAEEERLGKYQPPTKPSVGWPTSEEIQKYTERSEQLKRESQGIF